MSDDLIRRSDAIDILYREKRNALMQDHNSVARGIQASINCISNIPTIEPKRGEWIFKTVFPNDKSEFPMGYLVCSVCGSHHSNSTPCNYCDNCGADMRGADDE